MPYYDKTRQLAHDTERPRRRKREGKCASYSEDTLPGESRCAKHKAQRWAKST